MMPKPVGKRSNCRAGGGLVISNKRKSTKPVKKTNGRDQATCGTRKKVIGDGGDFVEYDLLRIFFAAEVSCGRRANRNADCANQNDEGCLEPQAWRSG